MAKDVTESLNICMDKKISILVDNDSWILPFAERLRDDLNILNFDTNIIRDEKDIAEGWICFMLGCTKVVSASELRKNEYNLVVHESALPQGKGFAPLTWQILEGSSSIPFSLIEAADEVDSGDIWLSDILELNGTELCDELRQLQGEKTVDLCLSFVKNYPNLKPRKQSGKSSIYSRRRPNDSRLDINSTIAEQFNLLRVCDNTRYPAYFEHLGYEYELRITKRKKNSK